MTDTNLRDREALIEHETAFLRSLGKDHFRLLWPAVRELATRQAVEPPRLATLAGLPLDRTLALLHEGAWEWDPSGERIVGAGLTMIETPHRVELDGRAMWAWCAGDALALPVILGMPVRIQSVCPATGDPIRIDATPAAIESVEPPSAVVTVPERIFGDLANIRQAACDQGHFCRDAEVASEWLAANPNRRLVAVAEEFEVVRAISLRIEEWIERG